MDGTGRAALEAWVARAEAPVLYFVSTHDLLGVDGPPELVPDVPRRRSLPFADFEETSRVALISCADRAGQAGSAHVEVQFRYSDRPTLVKAFDLRPDFAYFAFVLSDDPLTDDVDDSVPASPAELRAASTPGLVTVLDTRGVIIELAGSTGEPGDLDLEQLTGRSLLPLVHAEDRSAAISGFAAALDGRGATHAISIRLGTTRGWRWFDAQVRSESRGNQIVVVVSLVDVTERIELQSRLQHDATHDPLTGLANRTALSEHLAGRLRRRSAGDPSLAVIFIDLDGFKQINDSHGHGAGDQVLCALAGRLETIVRPEDFVARFGGDEFVVVVDQTGGPDGALALAHRMLRNLSEPIHIGDELVRPLASVGVALARAGAETETLIGEADAAMYEAKANGPGSIGLADVRLPRNEP